MSSRYSVEKRPYFVWQVRKKLRDLKIRSVEYLGGKCLSCGFNSSFAALVFHHRDPKEKDFTISGKCYNWDRLKTELDKCDCLCANCHIALHEREHLATLPQQELAAREVVPARVLAQASQCGVCAQPINRSTRYASAYCSRSCVIKSQTKGKWPSDDLLLKWTETMTIAEIARMVGVSDRSVSKRVSKLRKI